MVVVVVFGGGGGVGLVQEHGQRAARRVDSIVSGLSLGVCLVWGWRRCACCGCWSEVVNLL